MAECVDTAGTDMVIFTRGGKPIAALVPLDNSDAESVSLATNPKFLAIIERSRSSYRRHGGIAADDIRQELELDPAPCETKESATDRP